MNRIRTNIYDKYSGSRKFTAHLDHNSRRKTRHVTNGSNAWAYRAVITNIRRFNRFYFLLNRFNLIKSALLTSRRPGVDSSGCGTTSSIFGAKQHRSTNLCAVSTKNVSDRLPGGRRSRPVARPRLVRARLKKVLGTSCMHVKL